MKRVTRSKLAILREFVTYSETLFDHTSCNFYDFLSHFPLAKFRFPSCGCGIDKLSKNGIKNTLKLIKTIDPTPIHSGIFHYKAPQKSTMYRY